ncbi:NUDIX hydrolase [Salimicrobium halophilum]|uniref:Isopentenyldiphosphate isomerase n=1 Tax=Salimicrobium halophilum TaxID=86666 RepID=A0A1G8UD62_9BACI|nr:NUDIX domain-containing protein [Salimicrobium halophilum]SDJ51115.1 Isopentenyldiphosphate isomerase [Salimicrobium halophilum]
MEYIRIFTEAFEYKGTMPREQAHQQGEWHEVFHCWCVSRHEGQWFLYLQLRSPEKKDYPGLYDITAAGHIEADESVRDGVREVKEELGLDVTYEDMKKVALLDTWIGKDKEFAHEHMYECTHSLTQFTLQEEEVKDVDRVLWQDFKALWNGETDVISGEKEMSLTREAFVPHENDYYRRIIEAVEKELID